MVTIKDVAERAGVSVVTVSRAINHPEIVSEKRAQRIQKAIDDLGYTPNAAARSLVIKSTKVIGVLLPDINNIYLPSVVSTLTDELEKRGYTIFLCTTGGTREKEARIIRIMQEKRVDGMILLGTRPIEAESHVLEQAARSIPVVILDYTTNCNMYCVRADEAAGMELAVKHLVTLGHSKIALINGEKNFTTNFYKQIGYETALRNSGIGLRPEYIIASSPYYDGGIEGTEQLLNLPDPPTAIVTAGDQIAMGAYYAAQRRGYRIPQDISIVGFSGSPTSAYIYPPLTTVNQHGPESACQAALLLVKIIEGREISDRNIIITPSLIVRESCAPPRAQE